MPLQRETTAELDADIARLEKENADMAAKLQLETRPSFINAGFRSDGASYTALVEEGNAGPAWPSRQKFVQLLEEQDLGLLPPGGGAALAASLGSDPVRGIPGTEADTQTSLWPTNTVWQTPRLVTTMKGTP